MSAKKMWGLACVMTLSGVVSSGGDRVRAQALASPGSAVLLAPPDVPWAATNRPDTKRANVWGDSSKGPFGYFSHYDGGWELPPHFHTNDLRGVIVSGTFVIHVLGQAAKELPAGSYFFVPGKTQHTDMCLGGQPCVVYFTGAAPLDRVNIPVTQ
jgi:hypothetical protein